MRSTNRLAVCACALLALAFQTGLAAQSAPSVRTLYSLTENGTDGAHPSGALVLGSDGNFHGTTYGSTSWSRFSDHAGTVFRITAAGEFTTLYSFPDNGWDGDHPAGGLIQGSDGNFYGTTAEGGRGRGQGTVFKITAAGVHTILHNFTDRGMDGAGTDPVAGLVQGRDGNFYGTTWNGGGMRDAGAVFKITPAGEFTILHRFTGKGTSDRDVKGPFRGKDAEGAAPDCLIQGRDGDFYGTTWSGGRWGCGTVFKITPEGVFSALHSFTGRGTDGSLPSGSLVQGSDGNFYGTASGGKGAVFKITPAGVLTALHRFTGKGSDGADPNGAMVQGSDDNFYGTTEAGGSRGCGTVFKMTPAGALTTLYSFTGKGTDGRTPRGGLVRGSDGNLYGTTEEGGSANKGTVFRVTIGGKNEG